MQTIIWAISSMVILMLIIFFLPLGYTLKGKFLLVLTSFILSLGGLAAISIVPLWETTLMLFALIFFVAYFINNRLGALISKESSVFGEDLDDEFEHHEPVYKKESLKDVNLVKIDEELTLPISSNIDLGKDTVSELSPSPVMTNIKETTANESETIDDDISFFLERNTEVDVPEQMENKNMENDYVLDIESLLEIEEKTVQENLDEEIHELSPIKVDKSFPIQLNEEEEPLDDSLFDFLLAQKEVASERDDILDEIVPKEKVSLQK
ncbi:hypothetical protein J7E63_08935 [Bacillus sp. ISL-75]|uniref:hypothetical protein n=1 Tax=Bacillus sp. ISL-75 TaxID=2819137 RepID=UPI001BEAF4D5|nr:hypothetical protein [Bacillus sp. ISL-75]MBT2727061.1 hypothetical protein [Bacillus sp. ISL-75]